MQMITIICLSTTVFIRHCWHRIHPHILYRPIEWRRHTDIRKNGGTDVKPAVGMVCQNGRTNRDARVALSPDIADTEPIHTCCTGLLNGADMRNNGGTDDRPTEWSTWCAKMTEPIQMLGRLVWRHPDTIDSQTQCQYNNHPQMLYMPRPIEWRRHAQKRRNRW